MQTGSLISVIVPVYNVKDYLERCVESILGQDYENIEVFLVDDGSTDGSAELCDDLALKDDRIVVIHQKNAGQSVARNTAIKKASGEFIAFIDSDDFWDEDCLSFLLTLLKENNADISICAVRHIGFPGQKDKEVSEDDVCVYEGRTITSNILLGKGGFSAAANHTLFRGNICRNNLFEEGVIYEDLEYMVRISFGISKAVVSKKRKYNYFYRPNNSSSTPTSKRMKDLDFIIGKIKQEVGLYAPELLPFVDVKYISNSIWHLRSLHKGETNLFSQIRNDILKCNVSASQFSGKSDRILNLALKFGKLPFKCINFLYGIYGKFRVLF